MVMHLDNSVNGTLANVTSAGNTVIQNQAKTVCATTALGNLTASGRKVIAQNAGPKNSHTDISVPEAGSTITAPGNGYIMFAAYVHSGGKNTNSSLGLTPSFNQGYVGLTNNTGGGVCAVATPACHVVSTGSGSSITATFGQTTGSYVYVTIPCYQSDSITVNYSNVFSISPGPGYTLKYIPRRGD